MSNNKKTAPDVARQLIAGWLIDGSGQPARRDLRLEIRNGRFGAIEPLVGGGPAVSGDLDFADCTLMPALVDSHVHLFMSGTSDPRIREHQLAAGYDAMRPVILRHLRQHLAAGVLAVRDGGDRQGHARRFRDEAPAAATGALRLRVAGVAWRAPGRYGRLIARTPAGAGALGESLEAALDLDRRRCARPPDHVKIVNSGLNSLVCFGRETPPQFQLEELRAAVRVAHRRGLKVMVHANGALPVGLALAAGCDSIEHGFFMGPDNLAQLAAGDAVWVPTAVTMQAYARSLDPASREAGGAMRNLEHQLGQLQTARALGVTVALGTDAGSLGVHHGRALREEMALLMRAGFSVEEAVRSATVNGARLLGLPDAGPIGPGAAATFIAVKGGPRELPASLAQVAARFSDGLRLAPEEVISAP
ncbi:MAG TPA: amidohydrolase family protein [Desulfobacterales bacterium]|nr:amidohydrolase family protein [Desulfobacterales bacterium]